MSCRSRVSLHYMKRLLSLLLVPLAASCALVSQPVIPATSSENASVTQVQYPVDYMLVDKSDRTLILYARGQPVRQYSGLQFGDAPIGHKQFQGDERTPEGVYTIDTRNPNSAFHLSLRVSYPNWADVGFAESRGRLPGGDIFLHGQPNGMTGGRMPGDWTDGCIAFANAEMEELWQLIADGTRIEIRP